MNQNESNKKQTTDKQTSKGKNQIQREDQYKAPRDHVWGDAIRHEQVLEKRWSETWTDTIVPKELRPQNFNRPKVKGKKLGQDAKSFYSPKPSPGVPLKASEVIGWRSSDPAYSMEYFDVKYMSNKIRFTPQQYGFYRHMKYIQSGSDEESMKDQIPIPPGQRIRHVVKCLLC